jgi:hypothetical protein
MKESTRSDQDSGLTAEQPVLRGSTLYLVFVVLGSPRLLWVLFSFLGTVFRRFFFDQFVYRFRLRARSGNKPELRNVEHPLDATIPVRFETISVYLTFIQLWISAISYLRRCLGPSFNADFIDFLTGLRQCYRDASSVYSHCLTTTTRPAQAPGLRFAFVYAVDPHLFCVPSLHVLVVCYTYKKLEGLLRTRDDLELFRQELAAVKARALEITESILYVRQHSVNCIPTALSMLSVILPSYDETEAKAFLAELFKHDDDISEARRNDALSYMLGLYDRVAGNGLEPEARYGAIVDFLLSYEELTVGTAGTEAPEGSGMADSLT